MSKFVVIVSEITNKKYLIEAENEDHARDVDRYNAIEFVEQTQKTTKVEPYSSLVKAPAELVS